MSTAARPTSGLFESPREVTELSDLFANIWQLGYVTTDLEQGMELLRSRFGMEHILEVPTDGVVFYKGDTPTKWEAKFAMGARGGLIVELIEPVDGEVGFYTKILPSDGSFAVRLHHLATFVPTGDEEWDRIERLLAASDLRFDYQLTIPDRVRAGYIDTSAELGHFLEVCQLKSDDIEFFSGLVADSA